MNDEARPADERAPLDPLRSGRGMLAGAVQRADRVLDRGQARVFRLFWLFLPDTSIARNPRFEQVLASRFCSDAGQQALTYGALIALVRDGGSAFESALVGSAAIVPPALFGLYGGAVADRLPKRIALGLFYAMQAALCFVMPVAFGTDLGAVLLLIFSVNLLGQVSGPSESSLLPYVATKEQLASAASLVSLASNVGTAFGTAILAPVLVRAVGVNAVFFASGVMLLLAASRVFDLPTGEREGRLSLRDRPRVDLAGTVRWLAHERAVATMIFVAVLGGTASIVVSTLGPRYVSSVLHVDPADAVYVFAPSTLGLLAALLLAPPLVRQFGERTVALAGFVVVTLTLLGLGLVHEIAGEFARLNPLTLLVLLGADISEALRTAGLLAIALGFGLALIAISVQTYLNRRVPLTYQGRAFAIQSVLKNATAIVPLLVLGTLATVLSVRIVLILSPFALLGAAAGLVWLSVRFGGWPSRGGLDVLASYWEESHRPVSDPDSPGGTGAPGPKHRHDP